MTSEQNTVLLGELISHKKGFAFKSNDYVDGGVPVVRVSNFTDDSISRDDLKFVSESIAKINSNVSLRANDIVVATVGSWPNNPASVVGRTISVPVWAEQALMNQNSVIIRSKSASLMDQRFIYYQMKSKEFSNHVISKAQGSANQASITLDAIFSFPLLWPESEVRISVVNILSALDDRITLLRETNTTLEAIAQALFKSWFVDLDPVHAKMQGLAPEGMDEATAALFPDSFEESELGAVPKGWHVMPVGDAVETVGGATPDTKTPEYWEPAEHHWTTPKDLSGIASPVLLGTERKLSDAGLKKISSGLLPVGSLLMSSRAPIGYLALTKVPMAINQGYIAIPPGGKLSPLYMLFWCQTNMDNIKGRANGSTFMEISKKAFRPIPVLVPSLAVLDAFEAVTAHLFVRLVENEKQAQSLASIRDVLLPRLISGQLQLDSMEFDDAS
jgi:type I restriction enzyme S subunit